MGERLKNEEGEADTCTDNDVSALTEMSLPLYDGDVEKRHLTHQG